MKRSKDPSDVMLGIMLAVIMTLFFGLMFAGCISIQYIIRDIFAHTTHYLK